MKRLRGGTMALLCALERDQLDQPEERGFTSRTAPERRAAELRALRRKKKASKRAPF